MGGRSSGSKMTSSSSMASQGGNTYTVSEIPSRIQSFTTIGTGVSGDWESKTYVTRKGDAIKTVTTYSDGTKTTYTDSKNYGTEYDKTRDQYESILAGMAKSHIRAGVPVTAVNGKKKDSSRGSLFRKPSKGYLTSKEYDSELKRLSDALKNATNSSQRKKVYDAMQRLEKVRVVH